jgi:hypothetical protein
MALNLSISPEKQETYHIITDVTLFRSFIFNFHLYLKVSSIKIHVCHYTST